MRGCIEGQGPRLVLRDKEDLSACRAADWQARGLAAGLPGFRSLGAARGCRKAHRHDRGDQLADVRSLVAD
jgi:hypothetical protein